MPWVELGVHRLLKLTGELIGLGVLGVVLFGMVMLIANPRVRRAFMMLIEAIGKLVTLGTISFDEWIYQEKQIDVAEEDINTSIEETKKIEAICSRLELDVKTNIASETNAKKIYEIAVRNNDDEQAEDAQAEQIRCRDYIDSIGPVAGDMRYIINTSYEMQKKLKRNIKNLRLDLQKEKDRYYSYMAGANGLTALKRAWLGDPGLNKDAELAKQNIRNKVAMFTGQMRTNMEILGQISKDQNYRDRARFELARERMQQLSTSHVDGETPMLEAPISTTFAGITTAPKVSQLGNKSTGTGQSSYDDLIS